jgi:hypothetical protein
MYTITCQLMYQNFKMLLVYNWYPIPTDRQSIVDIGEFEVINYGTTSSSDAGSKIGSARTHSSKVK